MSIHIYRSGDDVPVNGLKVIEYGEKALELDAMSSDDAQRVLRCTLSMYPRFFSLTSLSLSLCIHLTLSYFILFLFYFAY